jgi:hypothetical protein
MRNYKCLIIDNEERKKEKKNAEKLKQAEEKLL